MYVVVLGIGNELLSGSVRVVKFIQHFRNELAPDRVHAGKFVQHFCPEGIDGF